MHCCLHCNWSMPGQIDWGRCCCCCQAFRARTDTICGCSHSTDTPSPCALIDSLPSSLCSLEVSQRHRPHWKTDYVDRQAEYLQHANRHSLHAGAGETEHQHAQLYADPARGLAEDARREVCSVLGLESHLRVLMY